MGTSSYNLSERLECAEREGFGDQGSIVTGCGGGFREGIGELGGDFFFFLPICSHVLGLDVKDGRYVNVEDTCQMKIRIAVE